MYHRHDPVPVYLLQRAQYACLKQLFTNCLQIIYKSRISVYRAFCRIPVRLNQQMHKVVVNAYV